MATLDDLKSILSIQQKEGAGNASIDEIKQLKSLIEKFLNQSETTRKYLQQEFSPNKQSERLKQYTQNIEKIFESKGFDENYKKRINKLNSVVLDKLDVLKRQIDAQGSENINITDKDKKYLSKELIKEFEKVDNGLKESFEDALKKASNAEDVAKLLDLGQKTLSNNKMEFSKLSNANEILKKNQKNISSLVLKTGEAMLEGTKEFFKPIADFVGGLFSEIKAIFSTLLQPLSPFINAGKAMWKVFMGGGKTPEQKANESRELIKKTALKILDFVKPGAYMSLELDDLKKADILSREAVTKSIDAFSNFTNKNENGEFIEKALKSNEKNVSSNLGIGGKGFSKYVVEMLDKIYARLTGKDKKVSNKKQDNLLYQQLYQQNNKINTAVKDLSTGQTNLDEKAEKGNKMLRAIELASYRRYLILLGQMLIMLPVILMAGLILGFVMLFILAWLVGGIFRQLLISGFKKIILSALDWLFKAVDSILNFVDSVFSGDWGDGLVGGFGEKLKEFAIIVLPQIGEIMWFFIQKYFSLMFIKLPPILAKVVGKILPILVEYILKLPFFIIESLLKVFGINTSWFKYIYKTIDGIVWLLTPIFKLVSWLVAVAAPIAITVVLIMKAVGIIMGIISFLAPIVSFIGTVISIIGSIFSGIGAAVSFLAPVLAAIPVIGWIILAIGAIAAVIWWFWDDLKPIFDWLGGVFVTAWDFWVDVLGSMWEVIKQIGGVILYYATLPLRIGLNLLGQLLDKVPFVPYIPLGDNLFNAIGVTVPQFAEGGVVNQETFAVVGEGGAPEAIIPLNQSGIAFMLKTIAPLFAGLIVSLISPILGAIGLGWLLGGVTGLFSNMFGGKEEKTEQKVSLSDIGIEQIKNIVIEPIKNIVIDEFTNIKGMLHDIIAVLDIAISILMPLEILLMPLAALFGIVGFSFAGNTSNSLTKKIDNILSINKKIEVLTTATLIEVLKSRNTPMQQSSSAAKWWNPLTWGGDSSVPSVPSQSIDNSMFSDVSQINIEEGSQNLRGVYDKLDLIIKSVEDVKANGSQRIIEKSDSNVTHMNSKDPAYEFSKYLATGIVAEGDL